MSKSKAKKVYKTEAGEVVHGIMAEFDTTADLTHAAEKVRDAGYKKWDVFSPFAVHGMDEAMGLPPTRLGLLTGIMGICMAGLGFLFQYAVTKWLYPMDVQGKPFGAWEPLIPVTFEFGVLGTAFTALLGMMAFNRLPRPHHPLLKKERFLRVSDDRLVICIEAADPKFDPAATRQLLEKVGGTHIDLVEE